MDFYDIMSLEAVVFDIFYQCFFHKGRDDYGSYTQASKANGAWYCKTVRNFL